MTVSLQIESLGEVKFSCECASRSVTSTRWDAEGGPLVDRVECDCDSVWEVLVGNWSPTASSVSYYGNVQSTFHSQIVACLIWVVPRIWYPQSIADRSITNGSKKVRVRRGWVLEMYGDGDNDVISCEFPSLEQGRHLNHTRINLVDPKVQPLRSDCNEVVETGVVLQPLRGHHFVVQQRVWGRAAHLRKEGEEVTLSYIIIMCDMGEEACVAIE